MTCQHLRYSIDTVDGKGTCIDCGADGWMQFVSTKESYAEHGFKEFSKLAGRALNDACAVIATIEPEDWDEGKPLCELLDLLRDLTRHAYSLNGVLTAQELKATEGKA